MALPALHALTEVGPLTIYGPRWAPDLYRDVDARVLPSQTMRPADIAVLFPPSLRAAWQGRRSHRRIGTPTDRRGVLLTDAVPWLPDRPALYTQLARAAGAVVRGNPEWTVHSWDSAAEVPPGHVGLVPVSAGGAVRQWTGFAELASQLAEPVVFYGGPGEDEAVARVAAGRPTRIGQPLPELAATLQACSVLVTNDSGLMHFGRAIGVPVVTVFGSTVPAWTGAPGVVAVEGPRLPCRPCYGRECRVGGHGCLDVPVAAVLDAVRGVLDG